MIIFHSGRVMTFSSMLKALAFGAFLIFAVPKPADAFCIKNQTDTRLLFTARLKGKADNGLIFRRWVDGGASACGTPERGPGTLEVFVFADEDSVEGCDDEIAAEGTIHLSKFEEFDNCIWGK